MTTSDICERARIAYGCGVDPVDYAEQELTVLTSVHLALMAAAVMTGEDRPDLLATLSLESMSRRILGSLMDAGWTPPEIAEEAS